MIAGIRLTGSLTGLLIIVLTVVAAAGPLSPPAAMLVVATGLFLILKVFTFASQVRPRKSWRSLPLWCVATPTLNASDFFASPQSRPEMRWTSDFLQPLLFALAGLTTIVFVVPSLKDRASYLAGYVAIAALLAVVHFGLLHLVVSLWNLVGLKLKPLMNAPWRTLTVAEFWGSDGIQPSAIWSIATSSFQHSAGMAISLRCSAFLSRQGSFTKSRSLFRLVPATGAPHSIF